MDKTSQRRLEALEACDNTSPLRVAFAEIGETAKAALLREGVDPDAGQLVLMVVFG